MVAQLFLSAVYKYFLWREQRVGVQIKATISCYVHLKIQNLESDSIKLWFETTDYSYVNTANLSVTNQIDHRHSFSLWLSKSTINTNLCCLIQWLWETYKYWTCTMWPVQNWRMLHVRTPHWRHSGSRGRWVSRPTWSTQPLPGQPRIHSETLSQQNKQNNNKSTLNSKDLVYKESI